MVTAKCLNTATLDVTLLVCWTVQMEGGGIKLSTYSILYYFRFVLKGGVYNPIDVMNCLMIRRGYKMQGGPQQRTLPNIHNKDDK